MRQLLSILALMALAVAIGCGSSAVYQKPTGEIDLTSTRLENLGNTYLEFVRVQKRAPKSADELAPMMKERGLEKDIFTSQHDGQPFIVIWGTDPRPPAGSSLAPIIAYEAIGKDGERWILRAEPLEENIQDADFDKLIFPAGHTPVRKSN